MSDTATALGNPKGFLDMVPEGSQVVTNQATLTDEESGTVADSTEAETTISGTAPEWTVAKEGPATARMNRDNEWQISVCGTAASALWRNRSGHHRPDESVGRHARDVEGHHRSPKPEQLLRV